MANRARFAEESYDDYRCDLKQEDRFLKIKKRGRKFFDAKVEFVPLEDGTVVRTPGRSYVKPSH